jgi:hypothetical protein
MNKIFFLIILNGVLLSQVFSQDDKLGEELEGCTKGCDCISNHSRDKFDKSEIIIEMEDLEEKPKNFPSRTLEK